jgi:hypothetical protein
MNRRVRGSSIEDLKLGKKGEEKQMLLQGLGYSYGSDTGCV